MPVTKRDYYEILGCERGADDQTIKNAYRKMALAHHPDRNPGDRAAEEKFKEAAEAYSVLSDGQKRAAYDRYGHAGVQSASGGSGFDPNEMDLGDILNQFGFGDIFGGGSRSRTRAQRGDDVRYDLELSFEDAAFGMSADIQVPRYEACDHCKGKGAEPGTGTSTCPQCHGKGEMRYQQGFMAVRRTCPQCNGAGQIIREACRDCRGEGYKRVNRKLKVNIPAGVADGNRLRLANEGNPGANGGPNGDLYVFIKVREHEFFERRENDLHCVVPLNIAQASLGTEIDVPSLEEPIKLKIPEGTQNGARFRLRNRGIAILNSTSRGDIIVHVEVKVPLKLTREQRKLMEELRDTLPVNNAPHEKSLFDKLKEYFA